MTLQDIANTGLTAAPFVGAGLVGYLVSALGLLGKVATWLKGKPDVSKDILQILTDLKNGQSAVADALKLINDAAASNATAAQK